MRCNGTQQQVQPTSRRLLALSCDAPLSFYLFLPCGIIFRGASVAAARRFVRQNEQENARVLACAGCRLGVLESIVMDVIADVLLDKAGLVHVQWWMERHLDLCSVQVRPDSKGKTRGQAPPQTGSRFALPDLRLPHHHSVWPIGSQHAGSHQPGSSARHCCSFCARAPSDVSKLLEIPPVALGASPLPGVVRQKASRRRNGWGRGSPILLFQGR